MNRRALILGASALVSLYAAGRASGANPPGPLLPAMPSVFITPFQFGAVGDGIADDTAAYQNALNASVGIGAFLVPRGAVFATRLVVVPSNTYIIHNGTTRQIAGGNNSIYFISSVPNSTTAVGAASNIYITGMGTLDGNSSNQTGGGGGGIVFPGGFGNYVNNLVIRDITITNCVTWPFNVGNCSNGFVENVKMTGSGNAAEFFGASYNCWFKNCYATCFNDIAICLYGGPSNSGIVDCVVENSSAGPTIYSDPAQTGASSNCIISGCIVRNCSTWGVGCRAASGLAPHVNCSIIGNVGQGNGTFAQPGSQSCQCGRGSYCFENSNGLLVANNIALLDGSVGNASAYSFFFFDQFTGLKVVENEVKDCGLYAPSASENIGFYFQDANRMSYFHFSENSVMETRGTPYTNYGVFSSATAGAKWDIGINHFSGAFNNAAISIAAASDTFFSGGSTPTTR